MTKPFPNPSEEGLIQWKQKLKAYCVHKIQQRVEVAKESMASAQESANREEKSSAGDKHETARSMSQLERDFHARQLNKAILELEFLQKVDVSQLYQKTCLGSVAVTEKGAYFIACGLGRIEFEGHAVFVVSPDAPLTLALMGKNEKEIFVFNNSRQTIELIF